MMAQVCYSMQGHENWFICGRAVLQAASKIFLPFPKIYVNTNASFILKNVPCNFAVDFSLYQVNNFIKKDLA